MTTSVRLGNALQPCSKVRGLADDRLLLGRTHPDQIADDDHSGGNADTSFQWRMCDFSPLTAVDQFQPRPHCPLGIVLMRLRVAEIREHAVAHVFRDETAEALHSLGDALLIGRNDLAQVLRVHPR